VRTPCRDKARSGSPVRAGQAPRSYSWRRPATEFLTTRRAKITPEQADLTAYALARALRLDDVERAHLLDLIRAADARPGPTRRRPTILRVRPSVQRILDR
jgi:hypothetical protein